jgi:hypothetical protein
MIKFKQYVVSVLEETPGITPGAGVSFTPVIPGAVQTWTFWDKKTEALRFLEYLFVQEVEAVLTVEPVKFEVHVNVLDDSDLDVDLFYNGYHNAPFTLIVNGHKEE